MSIDNITGRSIACILTLGAATSTLSKVVGHIIGHSISKYEFGINSTPLFATIGAIQQILPFIISGILRENLYQSHKYNTSRELIKKRINIIAHVISAVLLVGLTGLAAKTNLIASGLTLFGGSFLCTASLLTNFLYRKTPEYLG